MVRFLNRLRWARTRSKVPGIPPLHQFVMEMIVQNVSASTGVVVLVGFEKFEHRKEALAVAATVCGFSDRCGFLVLAVLDKRVLAIVSHGRLLLLVVRKSRNVDLSRENSRPVKPRQQNNLDAKVEK